jgi:hypothetical protein
MFSSDALAVLHSRLRSIGHKFWLSQETQGSRLPIQLLLLLLLLLLLVVGRYWIPRYLFKSLVLRPLWPIVQTPMIDEDNFWSNWWNENWQGKPKYSEKTYRSATLSTTKAHMTDPVSKPGPQQWEATNRLSYGAAFFSPISSPLTTRRVTAEIFDPASTRVTSNTGSTYFESVEFCRWFMYPAMHGEFLGRLLLHGVHILRLVLILPAQIVQNRDLHPHFRTGLGVAKSV